MTDQQSEDIRNQLALQQLTPSVFLSWPRLFRRSSTPAKYDLPSTARLSASLLDKPFDLSRGAPALATALSLRKDTVLYLAYGSNLCHETFQGRRGIKPLAAINVAVPSLRLTFDLPGMPYIEPCFANTGPRDPSKEPSDYNSSSTTPRMTTILSEKSPLIHNQAQEHAPYHKDAWHKPLIGIVYELTPQDFAHVIATEGGGSSYQDILIPCHALSSNPNDVVPWHPTTPAFNAHTLYAPPHNPPPPGSPLPPGEKEGGRFSRPDPSYAQPSARYLKLITDGAAEHELPYEYQTFLATIRPYTPSTQKQRLGAFIFTSIWSPIIAFVFAANGFFGDKDTGRSPTWLVRLLGAVFASVWASYDGWFLGIFGDGERTVEDGGDKGGDGEEEKGDAVLRKARCYGLVRDAEELDEKRGVRDV
jgi:hypothetical protein